MLVRRDNDIVTIKSLENPSTVDEFIYVIRDGCYNRGYNSIILQFKNCKARFPNVVDPYYWDY